MSTEPNQRDREIAENIFQSQAPGKEIKWGHCSCCDATLSRVSERISRYRAELIGAAYLAAAALLEHTAIESLSMSAPEHDPDCIRCRIELLTPADSERAMALRVAEARLNQARECRDVDWKRWQEQLHEIVNKLQSAVLALGGKL